MSVIYHRQKKKKAKYPRNRISRKIIHQQRLKKKIIKKRGWKLNYPDIFELIDEYPFIIRRKNR
jgi:hypothetical protein